MQKRTSKPQVYLNDIELRAIDEWRFENRLPSRAAAIRALIQKGLFGADSSAHIRAAKSREISVLPDATWNNQTD